MDAANYRQQGSNTFNQEDQNRVDNPLEISNENIQKVLEVKCKKHSKRNADLLHLVPNVENARICNMCVKEQGIPRQNYQEIRAIIQESSENDLLYYPVLTDSEPGEILQNIDENLDSQIDQMDKYFQDLRNYVEVIICKSQQARKLKLRQYDDIYRQSKLCWSEILDLKNLRLILLDETKEERLASFVHNHIQNSERNTQRIKQVNDQLKGFKEGFSVEQPNRILSLVCSILDEIDFFSSTHLTPLRAIEQSDEYKKALNGKQKELDDFQSQSSQSQRTMYEQNQGLLQEIRTLKENQSQEIISLKQENSRIQQEISNLMQENSVIKQQLSEEKESTSSLRDQLGQEKKSTQSLNQKLNEEMNSSASLRDQLSQEKKSTQSLNQKLNEEMNSSASLRDQLSQEKKSTQSLNQQLIAIQQQHQESISLLVGYEKYISYVRKGTEKGIVKWWEKKSWEWKESSESSEKSWKQSWWQMKVEWVRMPWQWEKKSPQWMVESEERPEWVESWESWSYAQDYNQWTEFTEEERQKQLTLLKKIVGSFN